MVAPTSRVDEGDQPEQLIPRIVELLLKCLDMDHFSLQRRHNIFAISSAGTGWKDGADLVQGKLGALSGGDDF